MPRLSIKSLIEECISKKIQKEDINELLKNRLSENDKIWLVKLFVDGDRNTKDLIVFILNDFGYAFDEASFTVLDGEKLSN